MTSAGVIFLAAILTNNILLVHFLGMCPFLAISRNMRTALGLGAAVVFVMTATTMLNYLLYYGVLVPLGIEHLQFIVFIMVIAGFVQFVELVIERASPVLYYNLGVFLPLITVNCAILGASLFMVIREYDFLRAAAFGAGSGIGWALVICAMAGIRERLVTADIPRPLKGLGISLIVTGLMAMAFMGFKGMVRIH
jgi:Na+-transporting NADH:ubiquinone oxidoreductase subunit E